MKAAPPVDNAAVRQAFALALDRQALTSLANSLGDDGRPATTLTPPETLGRDLYGQAGLPFVPARAAQTLAQVLPSISFVPVPRIEISL